MSLKNVIIFSVLVVLLLGLALLIDYDKPDLSKSAPLNKADISSANEIIPSRLPSTETFVEVQPDPDFLPIRDWSVEDLKVGCRAGVVFDTTKNKYLWESNLNHVLPIASLTKLMTATVALENLKLDRVVDVSPRAVGASGKMGSLVANEKITVINLIYAMLMESSNDAAEALAESINRDEFIKLMNKKTQEIGMTNTKFTDPSGFDPANVSTVNDLIKLVQYTLKRPLIWEILQTTKITLRSADGNIDHNLANTDTLLGNLPGLIGGKTGYTEQAGECMAVVVTSPNKEGQLIAIVLGSDNRISAIENMISWSKKAFMWE